MSRAVKSFIIMVCFIITAQFVSLSFFVLVPAARAEDPTIIDIRDKIVIPLGSYNDIGTAQLVQCQQDATKKCWQIPWLAKYIGNMYKYGVVIGSILAVMMIMIGGVMYLIGGLNPAMITRGKEFIAGAITGLALLLGSFILLKTVNPNLINLQPIEVEIIKEEKLTLVKFCSELTTGANIGKYEISGDSACGGKATFKGKDTSVKDEGTCIGDVCPVSTPKKTCVPTTPTSADSFTCRSVLIWGMISDPDERYLDAVWLYPVQGNDVKDVVYTSEKEDKGQQSYAIYREDLTADQISQLNAMEDFVLKIELNDTGYESLQVTYGSTAAGFLTNVSVTLDDEYWVGRDPKVPRSSDTYVGTWINPNCVTCGGVRPTKPGAKPNEGDGWITDASCGYFWSNKLVVDGGMRIDINANNFREATEIDCNIMDMLNPGGPKLPYFSACGDNKQCASNDCEGETVGDHFIGKCECNENADCPSPDQKCLTTWATWNTCVTCKLVGEPTSDAALCCSNEADYGVCECDSAADCPEGKTCYKPGGQANYCVPGKKAGTLLQEGDLCSDNWECISDDCESDSWYDIGTDVKRCECKPDEDALTCGKFKKCIELEDGCGWNYCRAEQNWVKSVPEGYDPSKDPSNPDYHGLCDIDDDCFDGKCGKLEGINGCDVCSKK